jgi:ABC-2 type transport system ATP-binding protein
MYVREYLQFVAGVHNIKNSKQAIDDVIALTGLTLESRKKTGQLSKGYKQRVGLAAALVHNPEVLILDEPTTGLDPNQIIEIRNVIKAQGANKTVLFSSHILQEVQAICDRVIIINKGEIVADSLLANLQKANHGDVVLVAFKTTVDAQLLQNLPAITGANQANDGTWQLATNNIDEARKQLLELSIRHNLDITSLGTKGNNLEDVFRELTKG